MEKKKAKVPLYVGEQSVPLFDKEEGLVGEIVISYYEPAFVNPRNNMGIDYQAAHVGISIGAMQKFENDDLEPLNN